MTQLVLAVNETEELLKKRKELVKVINDSLLADDVIAIIEEKIGLIIHNNQHQVRIEQGKIPVKFLVKVEGINVLVKLDIDITEDEYFINLRYISESQLIKNDEKRYFEGIVFPVENLEDEEFETLKYFLEEAISVERKEIISQVEESVENGINKLTFVKIVNN